MFSYFSSHFWQTILIILGFKTIVWTCYSNNNQFKSVYFSASISLYIYHHSLHVISIFILFTFVVASSVFPRLNINFIGFYTQKHHLILIVLWLHSSQSLISFSKISFGYRFHRISNIEENVRCKWFFQKEIKNEFTNIQIDL